MLLFLSTEEREEPPEGLSYRQQESHLCQQMKLATVSQGQESAAGWFQEETATCSTAQPCPGQNLWTPDVTGRVAAGCIDWIFTSCDLKMFNYLELFLFSCLRPAAVCQQRAVKASRPQPDPLPCPAQHAKAFHPFNRHQVPPRNHSNTSNTHASLPERQHLRGNQTKT